jgi:RimJ/RimL family protein N-acetyltransferase
MAALRYATGVVTPAFQTPRLLLRSWHESDRAPFVAMNADPLVMRYFPSTMTAEETDFLLERNRLHFERHGFGLWAVVDKATGEFAGYIGLAVPSFEAHFTPCVEIGWRLAAHFWNRGLATEGAASVLRFAFEILQLDEVVSFTTATNLPSRRVMEKLGMIHDRNGDFDHPRIPDGHPLRKHVLYRAIPQCQPVTIG